MSAADDARWDEVEQLVFECLELQSASGADAPDRIQELLEGKPEALAAEARRVLREVYSWNEPAADRGPDLRLPDKLGPYRLGERLGQGGMGAVYEAVDESLDRRVALKVIRPDLLAFGGARERFRREVGAVARLSHAGIVQVYQVGEDDGVPWFAMELVNGESLAQAVARLRGRDPSSLAGKDLLPEVASGQSGSSRGTGAAGSWERVCVRIVRDLADALAHAHGRGILHRDVKPSNVVVDRSGNARLLDFGLARTEGGSDLTRSGALLGSLPYAPPEQVRGDVRDADARADVYSLGVTLYELLTLRSPFLAEVEAVTRGNVERGDAPPIRSLYRGVSWEVATVTSVAMDRDPERRYQSMVDFAADLQRVLDRRPIVARPPGPWLRLRRTAERHPVAATATVAGLLALVAIAFVYTIGLREERDRALRAQQAAEELQVADRLRSYRAGVQAASFAIQLGHADEAREQLARCPEELRDFEWRHLMLRIDESVASRRISETFVRRVVATERGLFAGGSDGVLRHVLMGSLDPSDFTPGTGAGIMGLDATYDGDHVVTAHRDHLVRLWDGATQQLRAEVSFAPLYDGRRELEQKHETSFDVAITRDGKTAFATSAGGAVARIDVAKGELVGGFLLPKVQGGVFAIDVSPDGELLAVGYDHDVLLLTPDGELVRRLRGHFGFVFGLHFSPDNLYLLSASQDRTARMWRVADGAAGTVFIGHDGELHDAAFGSNGTVWTVSNDATLRNWNVATGRERQRWLGHDTAAYGVTVGRLEGAVYVVTSGWDGSLRKWDEDAGRSRYRIGGPGRVIRQGILVHDDGARCSLVDDEHGVRTFELPSGRMVEPLVAAGAVNGVAKHGDEVAFLREGQVFRVGSDEPLAAPNPVTSICYLDDGALVACELSGALVRWPAGEVLGTRLLAHDGDVLVLRALPGGGCLTAGLDGEVLIWDGEQRRSLRPEGAPAVRWDDASFSPDGKVAYLCGMKHLIAVELQTGKLRWQREVGTRLGSVATAAGGRRLLVGGSDRVLHIVDTRDGEELLSLPADNVLDSIAVQGGVAVTATVYSEVDLWIGK